jgi:hypothetical protein
MEQQKTSPNAIPEVCHRPVPLYQDNVSYCSLTMIVWIASIYSILDILTPANTYFAQVRILSCHENTAQLSMGIVLPEFRDFMKHLFQV